MNPPKFNQKYLYEKLERVTLESGDRFYVDPTGDKLSSVTTILSATSYCPELIEWRNRVGEKEAERIKEEACALGSLMHEHLENYVQDIERPRGNNLIRVMARNMADQIINQGLINIDEIWGMEEMLYYPGGYAGTADLIAVHNGEPAICDYKTARKMKSKDKITDYFCQAAAYIIAHNEIHGTDIRKAVIFMVDRDLKYKEFILESDEVDYYCEEWIKRLQTFLENKALRKKIGNG